MKHNTSGNQGGNPNSPEKVSIIGKVHVEYSPPQSLQDISAAIRDQTTAQQNAGNASDEISERGVDEQERANDISNRAIVLSVAALVAAIFAVFLNYKAIKSANKSADMADSTLKETKREFKLLNEPFLQLDFIGLAPLKVGGELTGNYNITNLGKFAAQVTEAKISVAVQINVPNFSEVYNQVGRTENSFNEYVTEGHPLLSLYCKDIFPLTDTEFKELNDPEFFYYLMAYYKYKNLITSEVKTYEVIIRYSYTRNKLWYMRNNNFVDSTSK